MIKKVLLAISFIFILVIGIRIVYTKKNSEQDDANTIEEVKQISKEYVTDDCENEWSDYRESVQERIQEAGKVINDENRIYLLKEEDNLIKVYYINEKQEEVLYKVTDISIEYLGEEDIKKLKEGIKVEGIQELNQLIEDFE